MAIGLILTVLVSELLQVFITLNYDEKVSLHYLRYGDDHNGYNISTDDMIPAV